MSQYVDRPLNITGSEGAESTQNVISLQRVLKRRLNLAEDQLKLSLQHLQISAPSDRHFTRK